MSYRYRRTLQHLSYKLRIGRISTGLFILLIVFFSTLTASVLFIQHQFEPILKSLAVSNCRNEIIAVANDTIIKTIKNKKYSTNDILEIKYDENGEITAITTNTANLNLLKSEIILNMRNAYDDIVPKAVKIPLGSMLRNYYFMGIGPDITVNFLASDDIEVDYKTEFVSCGINQTKATAYVSVILSYDVFLPDEIVTTSETATVPVYETIIVRKIPQVYLQKN